MTDQLRAFVLMGFARYGRTSRKRALRHQWVRAMLSSDPKLRAAMLYLGTGHILWGGSGNKWKPKFRRIEV